MTAMPPLQGCDPRPALITGGAGFVGSNLAEALLQQGRPVILFDNFSRCGVEQNFEWLRRTYGKAVMLRHGDICDPHAVASVVRNASSIFHLAAQVAVTTSLTNPRSDFATNIGGTFNVLEAMRVLSTPPPLIFTSTNKVYGNLGDVPLRLYKKRYQPLDPALRQHGIPETRPLQFGTPYGCSKGAADQYVLDYAKTYGLRAAVFRMSCIYGPRQFGTEDQGWVAHFLIRSRARAPLTFYGDGCQVRDVLYIGDLVRAFLLAELSIEKIAGEAFNIGGGSRNVTSLSELAGLIQELHGRVPMIDRQPWRQGDQRYYVSDTRKFQAATGWRPAVSFAEGVRALDGWLDQTRDESAALVAA